MEAFELFVENLLREKGLSEEILPDWEKTISDMVDLLLKQIDKAAMLSLSEEKMVELGKLAENDDFDYVKFYDFLRQNNVDLYEITQRTMYQFRALYIGEKTPEELVEEMKSL